MLAFAALLHDVGKPRTFEVTTEKDGSERIRFNHHETVGAEMCESILRQLRFSGDEIGDITACVANHMRFNDVDKMRMGKLKNLLARPTFRVELELHRIDCVASHGNLDNYRFLKQKSEKLSQEEVKPSPLLTGDDLLAMGYAEGPLIGEILGEVRELQLDEKLRTREEAVKWVAEKYDMRRSSV